VSDRRTRTATIDRDEAGTRRAPLGRTAIVAAAIVVADSEGVRALSMRRLARSLGYEVMSLYNHVANKDELLSSMVEAVVTEVADAYPYMVAHVRQHLDGNTASSFELVLDLILDGLVRLNANR
jgi:AcrR family transcriptional regulator